MFEGKGQEHKMGVTAMRRETNQQEADICMLNEGPNEKPKNERWYQPDCEQHLDAPTSDSANSDQVQSETNKADADRDLLAESCASIKRCACPQLLSVLSKRSRRG